MQERLTPEPTIALAHRLSTCSYTDFVGLIGQTNVPPGAFATICQWALHSRIAPDAMVYEAACTTGFSLRETSQDGHAMASVLVQDPELQARAITFARQVIAGLGLHDLVFHLEAFDDGRRLHFLEVAGRPGGACIVPHLKSQFDVDLQFEMMLCDLGLPSQATTRGQLDAALAARCGGGWVATPMPTARPCRVEGMLGLDALPGSIFDATLPDIGARFNLDGDEGLPGGRFHVRTPDEAQAALDLERIVDQYRLIVSECAEDVPRFPESSEPQANAML